LRYVTSSSAHCFADWPGFKIVLIVTDSASLRLLFVAYILGPALSGGDMGAQLLGTVSFAAALEAKILSGKISVAVTTAKIAISLFFISSSLSL
jgi:hypothetical protein